MSCIARSRIVLAMHRIPISLTAALLLAACSSTGTTAGYRAKSPPEMRSAASSFVSGKGSIAGPDKQQKTDARIQLAPSPDRIPLDGEASVEVLTSNSYSNAYVAFVSQVPVTRYFEILRKADCDDWVYLQMQNPKMAQGNPGYYASGNFHGGEPTWKCLGLAHDRYLAKSDERFNDSDGAIYDPATFKYLEHNSLVIGYQKVHMDGWAIRFKSKPSEDEIRQRLVTPALSIVDRLQLRTVLHYVAQNELREYAQEVRALLPLESTDAVLYHWTSESKEALRTLTKIALDKVQPDDLWRILEGGIDDPASKSRLDPKFSVANRTIGDVPLVVANLLVCRKDPGTADRLVRIVRESSVTQHKYAAAKALFAVDSKRAEQVMDAGDFGDQARFFWTIRRAGDLLPFECPYRGFGNVG